MDHWYYAVNGQRVGPVPLATLQQMLAGGQVAWTDLVWREGMPAWVAASQVPELANHPARPIGMTPGGSAFLPYATPQGGPSNTGLFRFAVLSHRFH